MRHATPLTRSGSFIEALESRQLLTVTPFLAISPTPLLIGTVPVTAAPNQGVTLHEKAGVAFTASVGTFVTLAPGTNLHASISWGDGTASVGTLKPVGVVGLDQIRFEVDGTHTYKKVGSFGIKVTVTKPGPTPTSLVRLVTTFRSRAIVTAVAKNVLLDGQISGKYSLAPTAADIGAGYVFNGTGTAGDLGTVSAHAFVTIPGFNATGHATGTMTLTQTGPMANALLNSVTLALTGPPQAGFSPFPGTLSYTITGGTGAFAGATGAGTIVVTLNNDLTFNFAITSVSPTAT
ncbi:MAG TPA: hypothetical protein VIM11_21400 [Tepidisphaeraceae bacterium]|jgi:hypothetical protein